MELARIFSASPENSRAMWRFTRRARLRVEKVSQVPCIASPGITSGAKALIEGEGLIAALEALRHPKSARSDLPTRSNLPPRSGFPAESDWKNIWASASRFRVFLGVRYCGLA